MKKVCALAAVCLAACMALALAADQGQKMTITVKSTQVRSTPTYLGKVLGTLAYGDVVTVGAQPADAPESWVKVTGPNGKLQGWVSSSTLMITDVKLKATASASQTASSSDVSLAGKGFNADVEAQYSQNSKLDYTWVNKMETYSASLDVVFSFITKGGLHTEGAAQ